MKELTFFSSSLGVLPKREHSGHKITIGFGIEVI
jgi:hypothetical protein